MEEQGIPREPRIVEGDSSQFFAELIAPGAMFLIVLAIWTLIRMVWKDVDDRRIWILSSSIASVVIFVAIPFVLKADVIPRLVKAVAALFLFVPFGLGCYLVFVEGLYRLRFLGDGFSFGLVFAALIYTVGGFGVVKATYNVSEFGAAIKNGLIRFDEGQSVSSPDSTSK